MTTVYHCGKLNLWVDQLHCEIIIDNYETFVVALYCDKSM